MSVGNIALFYIRQNKPELAAGDKIVGALAHRLSELLGNEASREAANVLTLTERGQRGDLCLSRQ